VEQLVTEITRLISAEWIKLRSLRSNWWTLAAMVTASIGLAVVVADVTAHGYATYSMGDKASWDPTNESLSGTIFGQLAIGVFGVLSITGEFASGTIRSSVAAAPRRVPLLIAKAIVYGAAALLTGELISLLSFVIGQRVIAGQHAPYAALGDPGVTRAVALTGVYLALVCLLSLGVGCLLRNTAGAITAVAGVLLVIPAITAALPQSFQNSVGRLLPVSIGGSSMAAVVAVRHALSPWAGTAVLGLYAGLTLVAAGWSLVRRDI
jgi:hypothetical protein